MEGVFDVLVMCFVVEILGEIGVILGCLGKYGFVGCGFWL